MFELPYYLVLYPFPFYVASGGSLNKYVLWPATTWVRMSGLSPSSAQEYLSCDIKIVQKHAAKTMLAANYVSYESAS
jgi:hypothetical protein